MLRLNRVHAAWKLKLKKLGWIESEYMLSAMHLFSAAERPS